MFNILKESCSRTMFKTQISLFWHLCFPMFFVYFLSLHIKDSG